MLNKIFNKKLPTILGFLILIGVVIAAFFLVNKKQLGFNLRPWSKIIPSPQEIHLSNVQDNQLTISWLSSEAMRGLVKYGTTPALENTALDDRDQRSGDTGQYRNHYVSLKNLQPGKTYYFKIGLGRGRLGEAVFFDNNGQPYTVMTGPILEHQKETKAFKGRILNPDKTPAREIIVYVFLAKAAPLSVLTDKEGRWAIFLNQARIEDLTQYAVLEETTALKIKAQDGEKEVTASLLGQNAFPQIPDLVLGHEPYDFKEEDLGQTPRQMVLEASTVSSTLTIDNPAEEGEKVNTAQPEFQGQGPPQAVLKIEIESSKAYSASITVAEDGYWHFTPPFVLPPGEHQITINYVSEEGKTESMKRNFVILAAGESEIPAITATPSGELEPSPSPSPSPSATPPARVSLPRTEEGMPATGIEWPTVLVFLTGILMIFLGFRFS